MNRTLLSSSSCVIFLFLPFIFIFYFLQLTVLFTHLPLADWYFLPLMIAFGRDFSYKLSLWEKKPISGRMAHLPIASALSRASVSLLCGPCFALDTLTRIPVCRGSVSSIQVSQAGVAAGHHPALCVSWGSRRMVLSLFGWCCGVSLHVRKLGLDFIFSIASPIAINSY